MSTPPHVKNDMATSSKQKTINETTDYSGDQDSILGTRKVDKKTQKTNGDAFVKELKQHNIQIVDNRTQSNIVWIIYDKGNSMFIEEVINKFNVKASLERRGAIATNNRPAWRVMI